MSDYIVQTEHLTKKLENVTIVDDLIDLLTLQSGVNSSRKKAKRLRVKSRHRA